MSWQQARDEAERWIDRLQLRKEDVEGEIIDLRPHAHQIQQEGQFRTMIFRAARRVLVARGAVGAVLPDR